MSSDPILACVHVAVITLCKFIVMYTQDRPCLRLVANLKSKSFNLFCLKSVNILADWKAILTRYLLQSMRCV